MDGRWKSLPLHDHREWLDACADVLNEEWPRSKTARLHMLEKSNDKLPYCIVLLERVEQNDWQLIGHSRLCMVHGQSHACFVESVVIRKSRRGEGLGRKLMDITEQHALRLGFSTVYLTTHDKQHFYQHVGYSYCQPIISLGSASKLLSPSMMDRLFGKSGGEPNVKHGNPSSDLTKTEGNVSDSTIISDEIKLSSLTDNDNKPTGSMLSDPSKDMVSTKSDVKTSATSCQAVQSVIPPPPPPAPPINITTNSSKMPISMDPSKIFWMKKDLKT